MFPPKKIFLNQYWFFLFFAIKNMVGPFGKKYMNQFDPLVKSCGRRKKKKKDEAWRK
jgi:hypothetical protein